MVTFERAIYGGGAVLKVSGRLDTAAAEPLKEALLTAVSTSDTAVILDMSDVVDINSAGFRSMTIAFRAAESANKTLAVAGLRPRVLEIFTISRFNLLFPAYGDARDALKALAPEGLAAYDA